MQWEQIESIAIENCAEPVKMLSLLKSTLDNTGYSWYPIYGTCEYGFIGISIYNFTHPQTVYNQLRVLIRI